MRIHRLLVKVLVLSIVGTALAFSMMPSTAHAAPLHATATRQNKPGTKHLTPNGFFCDPGGSYTNATHLTGGDAFTGVSPLFHNFNGTGVNGVPGQYENMTFTSTSTGTVGVSLSVSASIDANAIVAGAQVTTSATLSASETITTSNSITVLNVPPQTNVYAQYGVFLNRSSGHYMYFNSDCTTSDYGTVTAYVPDVPPMI